MKTYNLQEIKDLLNVNDLEEMETEDNNTQNYSIEEFDSAKTRILKYILYKKRTESEIRKKFSKIYTEELLDDAIQDLKEKGYINDSEYVSRAVNEFITLKNLSIKELRYKLLAKGLKKNLIEEYFELNYDELIEYEIKSAQNIVQKKKQNKDETEIKNFLMKKGYKPESIHEALKNY